MHNNNDGKRRARVVTRIFNNRNNIFSTVTFWSIRRIFSFNTRRGIFIYTITAFRRRRCTPSTPRPFWISSRVACLRRVIFRYYLLVNALDTFFSELREVWTSVCARARRISRRWKTNGPSRVNVSVRPYGRV